MIMDKRNLLIHTLCWGIILFLPLMFSRPTDTWDLRLDHFVRSMGATLCYMLVFYINYCWLIPKMYFERRKPQFFWCNAALVVVAAFLIAGWWILFANLNLFGAEQEAMHRPHPPIASMVWQSLVMLVLVTALALAVRMAQRWQHMEDQRREAEKARSEAELTNLRNQLNPHFLLNTLNNIYALIAFKPEQAQGAVLELSKLLRHVLYDNQQNFVPLYKEVAFINNYIELMRIRVTQNVTIENNIDVNENDATPIAPLIFISLIENAFKHGISPSGAGYIKIKITENDGLIECEIRNSNHPKKVNDKSGSGIGLAQVEKRLNLMYPGRHTWERGTNNDEIEYYSIIKINSNESEVRNS